MKKLLFTGIILTLVCLLFASCTAKKRNGNGDLWGTPMQNSVTVSGTARGHNELGIGVELTLVNGKITNVVLDLSNDTLIYTQLVQSRAPEIIIQQNTTNIDTIAGASETTRGIRRAGRKALLQVPGVNESNVYPLRPGDAE